MMPDPSHRAKDSCCVVGEGTAPVECTVHQRRTAALLAHPAAARTFELGAAGGQLTVEITVLVCVHAADLHSGYLPTCSRSSLCWHEEVYYTRSINGADRLYWLMLVTMLSINAART
jgi:hypothetical protein